ncbi:MAG: hypothetical protein COA47_13355 [Robiginitomaculum sp.]|nr:MAG: hypothetical protein COA47_13355 [Robiginitomaculum sp.]
MKQIRPPHRPFADGPPQFQPGLQRIEMNDWLLPDTEKQIALAAKTELFASSLGEVFQQTAGSEPGQREVRTMVEQAVGQTCQMNGEPDLLAASRLVSDDLCLMEKPEEEWILSAASLAAPTHFSLANTIGKSLRGMHRPVPDGAPGLSSKITMMFDRIPPGSVFERFNWTIQANAARFMPDAASMREQAAKTPIALADEMLHLRVERQTILRLAETGGVLFCIRICIDRLCDLDQTVLQQLIQAWNAANAEVRAYKKWSVFEPFMAQFAKNHQL